jgi:hypothetical protein
VSFPVEFQGMDWQKEFTSATTNIDVKVDLNTRWGLDYGANEVK